MRESIPASGRRLTALQALRTLACIGIISGHCMATMFAAWGVSVFVILSGFLMVYSYFNRPPETSPGACIRFSLSKLRRLYPLHVIMLLAALALLLFRPDQLTPTAVLPRPDSPGPLLLKTLLNLTLLQVWVPQDPWYFSLNGVSWYLGLCLVLYAAFPRLLVFVRQFRSKAQSLLTAAGIFVLQCLIGLLVNAISVPEGISDNFAKWVTYILPLFRLGDFAIGCCLGYVFLHRKKRPKKIAASLAEASALAGILAAERICSYQLGIPGSEGFRYNMLYTPLNVCLVWLFAENAGIFTTLLCCRPAAFLKQRIPDRLSEFRPLVWLGDLSGQAFLIHVPLIWSVWVYLAPVPQIADHPWRVFVLVLPLSFLLTALYRRLESRFRSRK